MNRYKEFLSSTALFGAVVTMMVGCADGDDSDGPADAMTSEETVAEYFAEAESLELAPGWEWPKDPPNMEGTNPDGSTIGYQKGYGRGEAANYWFCSWERYVTETAQTDKERAKAVEQLASAPDTAYYEFSDDVGRELTDEAIKAAKAGDFSALAEDAELNCPAESLG